MSYSGRIVLGIALSGALWGCAEVTAVRSLPTGARLFINDELVGATPVRYRIPADAVDREYRVRLDLEGYKPKEATLQRDLCPGRSIAAISTLGIFWLFKGSICYVDVHDFVLEPINVAAPTGVTRATRLLRLERLRDDKVLSDEDYRRYRDLIAAEAEGQSLE